MVFSAVRRETGAYRRRHSRQRAGGRHGPCRLAAPLPVGWPSSSSARRYESVPCFRRYHGRPWEGLTRRSCSWAPPFARTTPTQRAFARPGLCCPPASSLVRPQLPVSAPPLDFPGHGYTKGLAMRDRLGRIRDLPPFTAVPFHHATLFDPGEPDGCPCPVLPRR